MEVWRDSELCSIPEAIHLTGEVGGDLRGADHEEHLVVLMGGRRRPIEAACDDGLAVDDSELVVEFVAASKARGADALEWFG